MEVTLHFPGCAKSQSVTQRLNVNQTLSSRHLLVTPRMQYSFSFPFSGHPPPPCPCPTAFMTSISGFCLLVPMKNEEMLALFSVLLFNLARALLLGPCQPKIHWKKYSEVCFWQLCAGETRQSQERLPFQEQMLSLVGQLSGRTQWK